MKSVLGTIADKHRAVFVFAIMAILLGIVSYLSLPREAAPEIRRPVIFVTVVYPGVSAKDIEELVTVEIEDELEGVAGVEKITSDSKFGMSRISIEFSGDVPVDEAIRRTKDRVDIAKAELPADAEDPKIKELSFSDQPVFIINMMNPGGIELLDAFVDEIQDEIKRVPGVLDVNVSGRLTKKVSVDIDPVLLHSSGVSIEDVQKSIQAENVTIPGGELKTTSQTYSLSVSGEIKEVNEFADIFVVSGAKRVRLGDIAKIRFDFQEPNSINRMNGDPSISFAVTKRSGTNLIAMIDAIKIYLEEKRSVLPGGSDFVFSYDASSDIKRMVRDLENNILSGLFLVLLVTLFFLGFVNAWFVSLAIPFSMLLTFTTLDSLGITLNMVVLFSLMLALGMLVDNGIVIVENIYRHSGMKKSKVKAAVDGTSEVVWPITTSTLTTILAFFPIIFMPGIMGEFMSYLPKTVIIVLVSSLVVGITITMVFCSRFLRADNKQMDLSQGRDGSFNRLKIRYEKVLRWFLNHRKLTITCTFIVAVSGIAMFAMNAKDTLFFPDTDPRMVTLEYKGVSGTTLSDTDQVVRGLESQVSAVETSMETLQATSGSERGGESHKGSLRVGFKPYKERTIKASDTILEFRDVFSGFAAGEVKIREQKNGPPSGHDIAFGITGSDYTVMGDLAKQVIAILFQYAEEFKQIDSDYEASKPEIKISIDREKASRYELQTRGIATAIRNSLAGGEISKFRGASDEYDVVVRYDKPYRSRLDDVYNLTLVKKDHRISLSEIATIDRSSTLEVIKRRDGTREVSVFADFHKDAADKRRIKQEIGEKVGAIPLPRGYKIGAGEGQQVRNTAQQFLVKAFVAAVFLIFLVLVAQFNSVLQPLIIMVSVFLSVGGVLWGYFLSGMSFVVIMSGIGTISLAGVVVNNAIVLIDFINQTSQRISDPIEAVVEASKTRLRPVLLTALTTVIGLLPMALGVSLDFFSLAIDLESQSSEMWSPMAWTVIFGLSFATFLTLVIVPVMAYSTVDKPPAEPSVSSRDIGDDEYGPHFLSKEVDGQRICS